MTGGIRLFALLAFAVVSALVVYASSHDAAAAPTFSPSGVICFEKFDANDYHPDLAIKNNSECDGDPSPGVASDTRAKFCVGQKYDAACANKNPPVATATVTDSNFGYASAFIPAAAVIKPGNELPI